MNHANPALPPQIASLLHRYGTRQTFKTHETLIRVGEQCNSVYYVLKGGFLRRFYNESSSVFRTISFHLPTHRPFMTLNESYFVQKPSRYEIKSFQHSEILTFKRELVEKMNETNSFLREFHNAKILEALLFESEFKSRLISYSSIHC